MRHLPLDFRDQYFGCEIELTGITRATAARTLAGLFGTRAEHSGGGYDAYRVKDLDGKEWKIVRDSSIHPECRRRSVLIGETYKVELNSPKLEYGEMEKLQEVVRSLRRAGGIVNDSCGMHVHVDASKHTPQSLKNVLSIMYSKEDILFAALKVNPARIDSYCQAVDEPILEEIRKLPSGASMDQLKDRWYRGRDGSDYHYHQSRYHAFYGKKAIMYLVMPVLFRLLYTCGLRVSEALHLKVADVDLDAGVLAIYGAKGDKERLVGISDSMLAYMKSYRSNPLVTNTKSIYFFPAPDGGFYDTRTIYDIFRKCLFDAGIPHRGRGKGPRLHDLRHSFAVHILNKWSSEGKDIYTCLPILRTALGHDRITTTEKYLRLVPEAYMEVTEPFNDRFHTITEVLCNEE